MTTMATAMWGIVIGLGIAMALQPLPVLAVVLLLSVENGIRKAWAFVLGEFTVMLAIGVATVGLHLGTSPAQASRPASFVTLALGIAIFGTGAWWGLRVRRGSEASVPGWMAKLDHMQPWPAFVLGLFLPTYMLALAVGAHIVGTDPTTAAAVAGILTFLLIGMSTAYVPFCSRSSHPMPRRRPGATEGTARRFLARRGRRAPAGSRRLPDRQGDRRADLSGSHF
jgi:hypothetical protein